ncbi:hypothetical protein [Clostridium saccharoperbutylacetonicum]|uniref:hypothetical protein n=1 Tax=Clostridium saccharoperbutylacetonicum TaxID=36745 RepID=UPI0039E9017F
MLNNSVRKINEGFVKRKINQENLNSIVYKIYTEEIIPKYRENYKRILRLTNDKTKTKYIIYKKIMKWYKNENNINITMEKIFVRSKLGSYTCGGCGITASFFAGLASSGIIYYIDHFINEISPLLFPLYFITLLSFVAKHLSSEDKKVEMYNMFLEVLEHIEYDKNDN